MLIIENNLFIAQAALAEEKSKTEPKSLLKLPTKIWKRITLVSIYNFLSFFFFGDMSIKPYSYKYYLFLTSLLI